MSEYALQQVGKLVDQVDRIADAALRAARTEQARQGLLALKQDLSVFKAALRPLPSAEPKPGEGKGGPLLILAGVAVAAEDLALIAAMVAVVLLVFYILMNRSSIQESAADLWGALTDMQANLAASAATFAVTMATVRRRLEREAQPNLPNPCRDPFNLAIEAINALERFGRRGVLTTCTAQVPDPLRAEGNRLMDDLKRCLEILIRCLDHYNSTGWWGRLVGPEGIVSRMITRWNNWNPIRHITNPNP